MDYSLTSFQRHHRPQGPEVALHISKVPDPYGF
jgi:hypothetical protein